MSRYESLLISYFENVKRQLRLSPLYLGGRSGAGGGGGQPPGGFVGVLPQSRVAYDTTEDATLYTPASGTSLVDNLNHIRYNIQTIQASVSGIIIKDDGIPYSGIHSLNFESGFGITVIGDEASISVTPLSSGLLMATGLSGVYNVDLSSQALPVSNTSFTVANDFSPGTLQVFYNGIKQGPTNYTVTGSNSFDTYFTVYSGDSLVVDYQVPVSGYIGILPYQHNDLMGLTVGDPHTQYLTETRGEDLFYTKDIIDFYMSQTIGASVFTGKGQLITSSGLGSLNILDPGANGKVLVTDNVEPLGIAWKYKSVNQQIVFSIEGTNLTTSGIRPLRIYAHDVGSVCTINEIYCAVNTAPGSNDLHIGVRKNGSNVLTSPEYVTIIAGTNTGYRTCSVNMAKNDYLQLELIQGDATASDLTTHIRFSWEI